jgi:hypothetical protein
MLVKASSTSCSCASLPSLRLFVLARLVAIRAADARTAAPRSSSVGSRPSATLLRNKVLHSDFRAARGKLNELGVETQLGGVVKIDLPVATILGVKAGTESVSAHTLSNRAVSAGEIFSHWGQSFRRRKCKTRS